MNRITLLLALASLMAVGCGSSYDPSYRIPTENRLQVFEPPEEEDVLDQAGIDDEADEDEADEGAETPAPDAVSPAAPAPADQTQAPAGSDGAAPKKSAPASGAQAGNKAGKGS